MLYGAVIIDGFSLSTLFIMSHDITSYICGNTVWPMYII